MATQREVAAHLCTNEHRVRELVRAKVLPEKRARGGYDLDVCRHNYIRFLEKEAKQERMSEYAADPERQDARIKTEDELVKERARLAAEQAEKIALENRQKKRELMPVGVLEDWCAKTASIVRAELEALPGEMKRQIPHLRSNELAVVRRVCARSSDNIADFDPFNTDAA